MRSSSDTRVRPGLLSWIRGSGDVPKLAAVWWPVGWRCVGAVALVGALAGLAYESGKPGAAGPAVSVQVQYVITTLTKPAVAIPLASVIVIALASILRRLRFEWLVLKPGPIFVQELAVAPNVTDIDIAHLTTLFRGRLMKLRLHAPTPVPGATPSEDFLSVLDGSHLDASNMLGSIVSMLRAAVPTHGYEVSVMLTQQAAPPSGKPCLGVTAQLTRLPNEGVPIDTAWAYSWDEAIEQAADMVTAAVLPRTRLSNRAPWSGWRRYPMPGLVVHSYERAQELTSERRYDEALSHCFKALEDDPKSVDLRLCKGFIEEKLGLYMDAVATYAAARRVADKTARRLYNRKARRNRKASGRIARYRLAVLLGGIKFAHQWCKPNGGTRRDRQRLLLRTRLSPELQKLLEEHGVPSGGDPAKRERIVQLLNAEPAANATDHADPGAKAKVAADAKAAAERRYYELRDVFAQLAEGELKTLQRSLRWRRTQPGSLTPLSVKLTAAAIRLRLGYIEGKVGRPHAPAPETGASASVWEARPAITRRRSRRAFRTWTEEYSAATLFALPLLVETDCVQGASRTELEELAVEHLKQAMSSTPSVHASERRDWVLSEDPDLDGLRASSAFKHFEAVFFPSPAPAPRRPRRASRWEMSLYTNALLADTARKWETVWHQRRDLVAKEIDPHVVIQWSKDEAKAWQTVARMARDYKYWPARCELIDVVREWSNRYGFEPLNVALPHFARDVEGDPDDPKAYRDLCDEVKADVAVNKERLATLLERLEDITGHGTNGGGGAASPPANGISSAAVRVVPAAAMSTDMPGQHVREHRVWAWLTSPLRPVAPPVKQFERLQDELCDRDFWHRAAPVPFLQSVCDVHAAMWQRLHEWLEAPADHATRADTDFSCAIAQAARLSETSGVRWVSAVLARRVQRLGAPDIDGRAHTMNGAPTLPA